MCVNIFILRFLEFSDSGFVDGDPRREPRLPHSHRSQRLSFNGKEFKMAATGGSFLKIGKQSEVAANIQMCPLLCHVALMVSPM